jgi:hypothetical protein
MFKDKKNLPLTNFNKRLHYDTSKHTYIHTYLLTARNRVLFEKLTGLQQVKKFPAFYGTRRFITEFTITRHLSPS